ncbi:MAG: hypothetical protein KJ072_23360 [Verrucomicrobia bacterium]|nr:hypothetical protein [Verrucomicrobiota bacterium]
MMFLAALIAGAGWLSAADRAAPAPVRKTSFAEVTRHLDPGGTIYLYLAAEQWLQGLSGKVGAWRQEVRSLPGLDGEDQANIDRGFAMATRLIRNSGLESISGVGLSGIAIGDGLYRTRAILHRYSGGDGGYLWSLAGAAPHGWRGLDLLPADTAVAMFFDLDLAGLWRAIQADLRSAGIEEAVAAMDEWDANVEGVTGSTLVQLLESLGVEHGLVLTLDDTRKVAIPLPSGSNIDISEPGLALVFRAKDQRLFDWLEGVFSENPEVIRTERDGAQLRTLPVEIPLPLTFRPTLVRKGEHLMLASSDRLAGLILEVQGGQAPGLKAGAEFQRLARGMPTEGNQFSFVSERVARVMQQYQEAMLASVPPDQAEPVRFLQRWLNPGSPAQSYAVAANTASGWVTVVQGNQEPANAVLAPMVVFPVALIAGTTLPALANAKEKAQSIHCISNLKQIGLAAKIYAVDHDDVFPPDFKSMQDELATPAVLICPRDSSAPAREQLTWETFDPKQSSYEYLVAGQKDDGRDPQAVLARCRFHGHVCRVDGSVQAGGP